MASGHVNRGQRTVDTFAIARRAAMSWSCPSLAVRPMLSKLSVARVEYRTNRIEERCLYRL